MHWLSNLIETNVLTSWTLGAWFTETYFPTNWCVKTLPLWFLKVRRIARNARNGCTTRNSRWRALTQVRDKSTNLSNHHQPTCCLLMASDLFSTVKGTNRREENSRPVVSLMTFQCRKGHGNDDGDKTARYVALCFPDFGKKWMSTFTPRKIRKFQVRCLFEGKRLNTICPFATPTPRRSCGQNSSVRSFGIQMVFHSGSTVHEKQRGAGHSLCLSQSHDSTEGRRGGGGDAQRNTDPANITVIDPYVTPWRALMMMMRRLT